MKSVIPFVLFFILILSGLVFVFIQMYSVPLVDCSTFRCGQQNSSQGLVFNFSEPFGERNISLHLDGILIGDMCDPQKELQLGNFSFVVAPYYPNNKLITSFSTIQVFDRGSCDSNILLYNLSLPTSIDYEITFPNGELCYPICRFKRLQINVSSQPAIILQ